MANRDKPVPSQKISLPHLISNSVAPIRKKTNFDSRPSLHTCSSCPVPSRARWQGESLAIGDGGQQGPMGEGECPALPQARVTARLRLLIGQPSRQPRRPALGVGRVSDASPASSAAG